MDFGSHQHLKDQNMNTISMHGDKFYNSTQKQRQLKTTQHAKSEEDNKGSTRENLSSVFANNKSADQPAHLRSLISAFVFRLI